MKLSKKKRVYSNTHLKFRSRDKALLFHRWQVYNFLLDYYSGWPQYNPTKIAWLRNRIFKMAFKMPEKTK